MYSKKILGLFIIVCALIACNAKAQNRLKRYDVKSGIIEYKTSISGKVMGGTITGSGLSTLAFKDWGATELKEEKSTQTNTFNMFGNKTKETEHSHTMAKLDNGKSYYVDFDNQKIIGSRDATMDFINAFHPNSDAGEVGENMLESMGGKKVGEEKFLGYTCEIWEIAGSKQWMYKGVMLKMEMSLLGIETVTQATSAKFDISVSNSYFELPDFPIEYNESFSDDETYEEDLEDLDENLDRMSKMSFQEWKILVQENDKEMQQMSDEELHKSYDLMQQMILLRKGQ